MREIGSEFWDVPIGTSENGIFPESTQWFLSGRSALCSIVKSLGAVKTVAMPSWCCDSMIKPFVDAGIKVCFYPVYMQDCIIQKIRFDCDALLIMDYFGYSSYCDLSNYTGLVIRDITHSIFSKSYTDADYYFGSLRKWCGIWTGGYAWGKAIAEPNTTDFEYVNLRRCAMEEKAKYIRNGEHGNKNYLNLYASAEDRLLGDVSCFADMRDIEMARRLDVGFLKSRRRTNAKILMDAFRPYLIFQTLHESDCPLFVPILVPNGKRDDLRRYLINHGIYCPVHWPITKEHILRSKEKEIYQNSLSLVCDQRYSIEDMKHVVNVTKDFWQEI